MKDDMNSHKSDRELAEIIWDYMRFEQPLEKVDIIIGLGSSDIRTADYCAKLYADGFAPKILFSGARGKITRDVFTENEADVYKRRAIELGVPAEKIIVEDESTNSGENIRFVYRRLSEIGEMPTAIALVHKPYMLRRAYATLMKQWPSKDKPSVICSAMNVSLDEYTRSETYPFGYVANVMVGDLQRIKEYPKLGFQIEQEIPADVWEAYDELVRRGYTKHLLQ
ncbi:MAG: YdcF family protein [Saprospiraceae bacterium]